MRVELTPVPSPGQQLPMPTVTVTTTVTITPVPKPDDVPLTDQLQGWGTVAAVLVALIIALVGWKREKSQREQGVRDADHQRAEDRADADRRLHEERTAADRRLNQQLNEQHDRDRRVFLVEQLLRVGELYSGAAFLKGQDRTQVVRQLIIHLHVLPDPYASLLKVIHEVPIGVKGMRITKVRLAQGNTDVHGINSQMVQDELADNVNELLGIKGVKPLGGRSIWMPGDD
ncbi:hypothetical protein Pth03_11530 [Planotetraspora thailandica]|uniref:Uncharacterized protein n=1 Tax=Planotetraspora thailandica TaxID=487172 RepID=A0A8J3UVH5_9ACTN|nr:hypothetical protein [Planotetraspora thailandica]GII52764.1 hypothetical protein Pth03_11530 [Planotetraspora thailandica]